jgi:AraC-like DNA-binding protein/quercetin dioxygenase-like cupin family protein
MDSDCNVAEPAGYCRANRTCARALHGCIERSGACASEPARAGDWIAEAPPVRGVSRLWAGLKAQPYSRHRHDTYTVAVTESGVQEFDYRGSVHRSLPGQVVVLHPDEPHDGRPATDAGFTYLGVHLDPARVFEATCAEAGAGASLPFVANPIMTDPALADAVVNAFGGPLEPLHADELIQFVSRSLMRNAHASRSRSKRRDLDARVLERAREFLNDNCARVVDAGELEAACGETRFTVGEQFKRRFGTSPYRFLLMRRLEHVRSQLHGSCDLADLALQAGFADQAHMTRTFKSAFGTTPAAFAQLCRTGSCLYSAIQINGCSI